MIECGSPGKMVHESLSDQVNRANRLAYKALSHEPFQRGEALYTTKSLAISINPLATFHRNESITGM